MEKKYTAAYWRFKEIDAMIREGCVSKKHKKVADMAQALGVSCRTIQRDIAYMTGSIIGLPIQYNASNHTYFYTEEDLQKCSFANLLLSPKDKQFIAFARSVMLAFFYNSESYLDVFRTFDTLIDRLEYAQTFMDGPMPTAMLLAPKKPQSDHNVYDLVQTINSGMCIWIDFLTEDTATSMPIRPVHVIYAWSNWYLLYIDNTFSYKAEDFKIVDLSSIYVGRSATKKEQSAIPHIEYREEDAHTYDSSKPVHTACRIDTERCRKDGTFEFFTYEYLTIDIYGEACIPYCMQYLRNPDNTLAAACSFHPWAEREYRERKMFMQLLDML